MYLDSTFLMEPLKIKNGFLEVPNAPGLGIELDMKMVRRLAN